ncbi:FG-GAP repeat protein [Planctomycetes bacterium Pla163]|uniref:FG-GAP repeat protein n=1 Tax=Rohdeia mirabilis TaxID=2528008 RepID=A0A518D1A2_9BACT|nr:FG-GAP repeat protein [Planctomycetes bacterium Pla163]
MDIDADGHIDILSGCYSDHKPMAGLFWVLKGKADGTFAAAESLKGTDGKPLIIHMPEGADVVRTICTRPTALDYDGDGDLDIVSGNFEGTFHLFEGLGNGTFAPRSTPLVDANGEELTVGHHSDPVFVDWDGDGDRDLVSGSGHGIHIFTNNGESGYAPARDLFYYTSTAGAYEDVTFGEAHITKPQGSIRLWIEDMNGDGRFDLVMGDSAYVTNVADGLTEDEARTRLAAWQKKMDTLLDEHGDAEWDDAMDEAFNALYAERATIVTEGGVGFVWVAYQQERSGS